MKKYLCMTLAALLLAVPTQVDAKAISAKSVNTFQTWSFGSVKWHQLLWNSNRKQLSAVITFTNDPYVLQGERRLRETGIFYFTGASRDKNGTVRIKGVPIGKANGSGDGVLVELLPTTQIAINKSKSGLVRLTIRGSTNPSAKYAMQWDER